MSYSSRSKTGAIAVWLLASVFYAYQYLLRVMPNIMLEDIMREFDISAAAFGQFSGIYYIGYSLMHLPIGIMLDRYGPRKIMTGSILMTVVGLLPLIFAEHWAYPILGRMLIGMGSSAAILGLFKIIRLTFKEAQFSRMLSFSVTLGLVGAIYGGGPVSYMNDILGYQSVIQIFAVGGVCLAGLTYWMIPNETQTKTDSILSNVKEVLSNRKVIWLCLLAGFMVGPLEGFADVWGTAFFKQVYGFDSTLAASLPSMIFIGMCFGAPVLSLIAEKTNSYLGTIIGSGLVMAISFCCLIFYALSSTMLSISFTLVGVCCAYQILAIYKASTYVREEVAGLTTAVANMIIMIFGYIFHSVIGNVVNLFGGPGEAEALSYGIATIPLALFIGTFGFVIFLVREKMANKQVSIISLSN
ncbi:putative to nasA protein [Chlamydiales bacterium STE3]|nr:putative to nasA protein [Chlamydiales bacterium STE3]